MGAVVKRPGPFLALVIVALSSAELPCDRAEAAVRRGGRAGAPVAKVQEDGSIAVDAQGYNALIGADGNLHSFRVGDVEMLDDRIAISLGSFFYADGPRRLTSIKRIDRSTVETTDGKYTARYRLLDNEVRVLLTNRSTEPVPYFVVLSPDVTIVSRPGSGEAAAVPANERWGAARFQTENGAYLDLTGGTRIWGPWLGRQVWEVTEVPPRGKQEVRFLAGRGEPPSATLEQLVGIRADTSPESGLVSAGKPVEVALSLENRSDHSLQSALSLELAGSRGDVVIYTTSALELPPQRVTQQSFRWQMAAPDFYSVKVTATSEGREIGSTQAAAGYRVSEIVPLTNRPADFDEFWHRLVQEASRQPLEFRMHRDARVSRRNVDVWAVQYRSLGDKVIHGWYAAPSGPRQRPAILYLSGYGARPIPPPVGLASHGWVVLAIDIRGNPVDRVRPRPFEDYCTEGIESPDTYVYRQIVGHSLRALNFLLSREEVDPHRVAVVGVSEGGGLGLILSALSPSVAAAAADAPMLVDFPLSLRAASWPYTEIAQLMQQRPEMRGPVMRTLRYFDAVNFAPDVQSPVLLSIGLLDSVSLPAAVFGLYNVLPGPKEIRSFPKAGHEGGGEDHWTYKLEWLEETLGRVPDS